MNRNHFIDFLKGILCIFVIVLHFPFSTTEQSALFFPFWINMTVPCFMLISGYVASLSYKRNNISNLEDAYNAKFIYAKLARFLFPFTIAFGLEYLAFRLFDVFTVNMFKYGLLAFAFDFLRGGYGPGSYYTPLMLQFIFLFPVIFFIIKKYNFSGVLGCFFINALYEVFKTAFGMNDTEYRLLIFRYLFVIAAGCYIAIGETKSRRTMILLSFISMSVGALFIYLFAYTDYRPKIISYWSTTSFVTCLFIIPIMGYLIKKFHFRSKVLGFIGKASYHIFLAQMIYYVFADYFYKIIPNRNLQLIFNIGICIGLGILLYFIDFLLRKITRNIQKALIRFFQPKSSV